MNAIRKKMIVDNRGKRLEVVIPWGVFCEISEALGMDLDNRAKVDLRAAKRDLKGKKTSAFKSLSSP